MPTCPTSRTFLVHHFYLYLIICKVLYSVVSFAHFVRCDSHSVDGKIKPWLTENYPQKIAEVRLECKAKLEPKTPALIVFSIHQLPVV